MIRQTILAGSATLAVLLVLTPALANLFHDSFNVEQSADALNMSDPPGITLKTRDLSGLLEVANIVPPPVDAFPDLLRLDDEYAYDVAPSVSREVTSRSFVTKIGYGKTETIEITTTASGVYSSDGIDSPNILYPGITPRNEDDTIGGVVFLALKDGVWHGFSPRSAGSFVQFGSGKNVTYMTNGATTCVSGKGFAGCF